MDKRRSGYSLFLIFTSICIFSGGGNAQETEHFTFASNTGNNMTVLVKSSINPVIDGEDIENGDEIGVFNDDDLCVGAAVWNGQNVAITVWGDNDQTDENDGMAQGDTLRFRIWDESESDEHTAEITFEDEDDLTYGVDAIAIVSSLEVVTTDVLVPSAAGKRFGSQDGFFRLYDMKGRLMQHTTNNCLKKITRNGMTKLPAGAFLIMLSDKEGTSVQKYTTIR